MRIWIDLANSPQVLFFRPIIAELQNRGHELTITSRYFAQTVELADQLGLDHTPIGGHAGEGGLLQSMRVNYSRARQQLKFLADQEIHLAVSHNSYAQAMACAMRRLPMATAMDYEHQRGNHLPFRVARLVIVPEAFPDQMLQRYGARRVFKYPGVKEQIYLADFTPDPDYRHKAGLDHEKIVVLMRPPATWALYHQGYENRIFEEILQELGQRADVQVVFLPRIESQRAAVEELKLENVLIPKQALDGPNLIFAADLVLSAGGTMNREAAVLGTPVYTLFAGEMAAADRYLMDLGRLFVLKDPADLPVARRATTISPLPSSGVILAQQITDHILSVTQQ